MSTVYKDQHEDLSQLLHKARNPNGATLLIPDLQRPYVWMPGQVTLLVDSLIRGWPFGTLLLWEVHQDDLAKIPFRTFWEVVDRTDGDSGIPVSQTNPPAQFQMVLDGQQRIQSLLLAVGGDAWGFKLLDREWYASTTGKRLRGPAGKPHWSLGTLCVNLQKLANAFAHARRIIAINFEDVLEWVVTSSTPGVGQSVLPKPPNYPYPINSLSDPAFKGRYVRLSRLWDAAPSHVLEPEDYEEIARKLLEDYETPPDLVASTVLPLRSLLIVLSRVQKTRITYLEVQRHNPENQSDDSYNEAVVNIFTRLNTAGRTLSREEITFAWLKVEWDRSSTNGRGARECFAALTNSIQEHELDVDLDAVISAVSFLWAVGFKSGSLISDRDLLKPSVIKPMAADLAGCWHIVEQSIIEVLSWLNERDLRQGAHYQSLNAIWMLCAWNFLSLRRLRQIPGTTETQRDGFAKKIKSSFEEYVDRWIFCSSWAGHWAGSTGKVMASHAQTLAQLDTNLKSDWDLNSIAAAFRQHLAKEVAGLTNAAVAEIENLQALSQDQVRVYYGPLWIWHRLDGSRWEMSRIPLRLNKSKDYTLEVDHIISVKLWQTLPISSTAELQTPAVNQIGNCFLLEKSFNISKGKKSLKTFVDQIAEFQDGKIQFSDWVAALGIGPEQAEPSANVASSVIKALEKRTESMKEDLTEFARGSKKRVDTAFAD